jgi:YebC/PmpR family DNA-binding regulatory protein
MSGHSKWSQIKHQKGTTDKKRGQLFSKLGAAIAAAAKTEPNPQFNPRLRSAIDRAREFQLPNENIERAIKKGFDKNQNIEELIFESYGPGGVALLIEAITDNRNRTVAEVRKILNDKNGRWAESGSVRWAFEQTATENGERTWQAKFPQAVSRDDQKKLMELVETLEAHADIQNVFVNVTLEI